VQTAQRDGDFALHRRADGIATELISRSGPDPQALTLRATVRAGLHRFEEAMEGAGHP
jgi:hypothetical protein